jgi:hypothetical protein
MYRFRRFVVMLVVCVAMPQVGLGAGAGKAASGLRVYEVNKKVSDFPEEEDFSTPESAYAVINRIMADGEESAWGRASVKALQDRVPGADAKKQDVAPEIARMWREALIVEVRIFRDTHGTVIAKLTRPGGETEYDQRAVELEGGRWLNYGQNVLPSLEAARARFARNCSQWVEKRVYPRVDDPESYLQPFVEYLQREGQEPTSFVLKALAGHKMVILGEVHHRPRYWAFNRSLVEAPAFGKTVGTIYMELPSHAQALVDRFLAAETLDTAPVIEMLRDVLWTGWPDQPMLEFFEAVWRVNQGLTPEQRLRIVLVDMPRPWAEIKERGDWAKYNTDRDELMAENVLKDQRAHAADARHALFIVGVGHAMLNLKYADGVTPMCSAGWYLREALGADAVYAILPHTPMMTNVGRVDGRLILGLFDSAFEAMGKQPTAFALTRGPFGEQAFDALPDRAAVGTYRDGYSAYLYLGPLEDEVFSPLIPGFYTDAFVRELDRRHRLMWGKSLVEAYGLPRLDGESFVAWMSHSWGQPRRSWKHLGPVDAWRYGSDWKAVVREEHVKDALAHPEVIRREAARLFEAIRHADYERGYLDWKRFPSPDVEYRVHTNYPGWARWVCREFKRNPIASVELGAVFRNKDGLPTIAYKLTRADGEVLEGELPFEYLSMYGAWEGREGLDWHLGR